MEKLRLVRFVGCVFVALGLGWGALVNALVDVTARSNPKVALQFDPDSAAALAAAATQKLIDNPASLDVKAVAAAARRSLQAQALNPGALALAGYAADMQGDTARADALIRTSERMTRRNLLAQLWLIENRVNAGDIAGALRHYDIALRVSDEAGPRLLPVLAGAMQQADVRRQLVAYLRAPWMPSLLSYATSNTDPRSVAAFIRQAGGLPRGYADPQLPHLLITTLVGKGFLQEARAYYFVSAKAGDATASDLAFSDDAADPAKPLGWQITDQDGVETSVQNGAAGEWELSIAVGSDAGGVVMQKLLMLDPGRYRIVVSNVDLPDPTQLSLSLSCANKDAVPYLQVPVVGLRSKPTFVVPSGCPVQAATLFVARRAAMADRPFIVGTMHIQAVRGG